VDRNEGAADSGRRQGTFRAIVGPSSEEGKPEASSEETWVNAPERKTPSGPLVSQGGGGNCQVTGGEKDNNTSFRQGRRKDFFRTRGDEKPWDPKEAGGDVSDYYDRTPHYEKK